MKAKIIGSQSKKGEEITAKNYGEETSLIDSTEQITNDLIVESLSEKSKCKCFNWFKCKKKFMAGNSGHIADDCIILRFVHKQHHLNF